MDISQIESIAIYSLSTENVAILSESDTSDLFQLIKQAKISGKGNDDFRNYTGRGIMFHIKPKNKKGIDFAAKGNIFYIINEKGYHHDDYEISSRITDMYYLLVEKYFPR